MSVFEIEQTQRDIDHTHFERAAAKMETLGTQFKLLAAQLESAAESMDQLGALIRQQPEGTEDVLESLPGGSRTGCLGSP